MGDNRKQWFEAGRTGKDRPSGNPTEEERRAYQLGKVAAAAEYQRKRQQRSAPASQGDGGASLVNLNTASAEVLELLPGVGESLAEAIVEARPFSSLKDIERVSGIGPSLRKKLAKLATC